MDDFRAASALTPLGDVRVAWEVPDGRQQGQGDGQRHGGRYDPADPGDQGAIVDHEVANDPPLVTP